MNIKSALAATCLLPCLSLASTLLPVTATSSSDFTFNFNGFTGSSASVVAGLTGTARFYSFVFTPGGTGHAGETNISFKIDLENTSSSPIATSRISALGFNTTPNTVDTVDYSVSGAGFDAVTFSGNMPNGIGAVEFCLSDVNCAGGGSGGVTQGQKATIAASLYFGGANLTQLTFDNAYNRYQSITCSPACTNLTSASGEVGNTVPEPGSFALISLGIAGVAVGSWRRRKNVI